MATNADPIMISQFVDRTAKPIYNFRMGRGMQHTKAGKTRQERAEQELHDAIMDYAMTYAVTHNVEVS